MTMERDMEDKYAFRYKGRILHCDPMPMDDGRYSAQVTISSGHGDPEISEQKFPALRHFAKEEDAVEYAHDHGKRWINEHS